MLISWYSVIIFSRLGCEGLSDRCPLFSTHRHSTATTQLWYFSTASDVAALCYKIRRLWNTSSGIAVTRRFAGAAGTLCDARMSNNAQLRRWRAVEWLWFGRNSPQCSEVLFLLQMRYGDGGQFAVVEINGTNCANGIHSYKSVIAVECSV